MGMSECFFRVLGDIHGELKEYVRLASEAEYSIQVGDLGFRYAGIERLDPTRHRCLAGNHDNYATLDNGLTFPNQTAHFLGDYGILELPGVPKIFYMRGGRSVDKDTRFEGHDWWPDEELRYGRMNDAIFAYSEAKPDFVITHECPAFLVNEVTRWKAPLRPSNTAQALQVMWTNHQPMVWIFGHFHHDWSLKFNGTYFRCLDIRTTYDMPHSFKVEEVETLGVLTSLNLGGK